MVQTRSNMFPLGKKAPSFSLTNGVDSETHALEDLARGKKGIVLVFMCNHCPFVKHILKELQDTAQWTQAQDVAIVAINSNDVQNYPEDAPVKMKELVESAGLSFPYLFDEDQSVAKAYTAACTPDFYLFDDRLTCVYRGRFDDSTPGNDQPVTGQDLRKAVTQLVEGDSPLEDQFPSVGCNIKWKN